MKTGWQTKTLEEACQFSNGLWKGEKPPFVNVGVIRNTNFTKDGTLDDSDIAILDVEVKKFEKRRLQFGDIILEKSGGGPKQPVGRVALFDKDEGDFSFSNFTAALRVLDPEELDFRFLHKFLHWTYVSGVTQGIQSNSTGIRNLDGNAYKAIEITYPPLSEQQRIVGLLNEAFKGIATAKANAEKNLQNARALFVSHLQSVFTQCGPGWVETTIGEACVLKSGTTVSPMLEKPIGDVPYLKVADMTFVGNADKITTSSRFLCDEDVRESSIIPKGSTIFPKRGGAILTNKKRITSVSICADLNIMAVIPSSQIDSELLYLYFINVDMRKLGTGSTIPQINNYDVAPLLISFPAAISEQRKIVAELGELRKETQRLARLYERKLAALEALKKSLLHQAFSGEL